MIRLEQLKLPVSHNMADLEQKIRKKLKLAGAEELPPFTIRRRSLDARKKPELFYVYTIDLQSKPAFEKRIRKANRNAGFLFVEDETYLVPDPVKNKPATRPVVIGSGPAGLFCAYLLAQCHLDPLIVERGESVDRRSARVDAFWAGEEKLHPESNVQFGEGGAGTFSDGKLNTLVHDKGFRNRFVLDTFVRFGAKEEIAYVAKPHIGTDVLRNVIRNMREEIISLGGTFVFGMKCSGFAQKDNRLSGLTFTETFPLTELPDGFVSRGNGEYTYQCDTAVLSIGHSARDTFEMLYRSGMQMEQKNFAVGLRMEHKQAFIDKAQYGLDARGDLPAADYKLTGKCSNGRSIYSFCMCPGGYVVNASSEEGHLAVNGMSYSGRDGENANAALIVSVNGSDFGSDHPLAGLSFVMKLEQKAYELGKGAIPIQRYDDYKLGKITDSFGSIRPSVCGKYAFADLSELFDEEIRDALIEGIEGFDSQIRGFADPDALLSGVESRTSSPVRIIRDETLMSPIRGFYPCGEGAGYAGGITSAAMDGMKVAEAIIERMRNEENGI